MMFTWGLQMISLANKNSKKFNNVAAIDKELSFINYSLDTEKELNERVLVSLKNFTGNINVVTTSMQVKQIYNHIKNLNLIFEKSHFNLVALEKLLERLHSIKQGISSDSADIINKINLYNVMYAEFIDKVLWNTTQIEQFLEEDSLMDIISPEKSDDTLTTQNTIEENLTTESIEKISTISEIEKAEYPIEEIPLDEISQINSVPGSDLIENILVISETKGNVVLPYKLEELNKILEDNSEKYNRIEDIIDTLYTKPIKYYKNSSFSRFREAFKLIKEREHGSFTKALDLAIEVFANYNLHPAIITACRTLDELDVYLSCLEYNELEDFHSFKVVFDVAPTIRTKISKSKLSINY